MSFSIQVAGRPADVVDHIRNHPGYGDPTQLEVVKAFLCAQVEAMPDTITGVYVSASGHHDDYTRQVNIELRPMTIANPDPGDTDADDAADDAAAGDER